ncbi:MAG: carboxymuconolactone decarboxylase family protein, partial [Betaproteobacteria bacterium]
IRGPAQVWLAQPSLGLVLERLGATVRFESTLTARAREIATLLVAHHHASAFELYAHERLGRTAGLTDDDLAGLAGGALPAAADEQERAVHAVTRRLLEAGDLSDAEYAEAVRQLGVERLIEVVTLVGYYGLLALQMRVFRVNPPSDDHQRI